LSSSTSLWIFLVEDGQRRALSLSVGALLDEKAIPLSLSLSVISDESFDLDESFDEMFDKYSDQTFEQTFENLCNVYGDQQDQRKKKKKRVFIERNREEGHLQLWNDYFSDAPTYPANLFRRRFRMNKPLFMYIVDRLSNEVQFFRQKKDVTGRQGLSPLQKLLQAGSWVAQMVVGGSNRINQR